MKRTGARLKEGFKYVPQQSGEDSANGTVGHLSIGVLSCLSTSEAQRGGSNLCVSKSSEDSASGTAVALSSGMLSYIDGHCVVSGFSCLCSQGYILGDRGRRVSW